MVRLSHPVNRRRPRSPRVELAVATATSMGEFHTRKIAVAQSLGECLAQRRAARHLSLAQAAQQVNVNVSYLAALEQGDHAALPGTVYALAFLKAYAQLLGLDVAWAQQRYRSELKIYQHARGVAPQSWRPVRRAGWRHFLVPARLARNLGISLALAVVLAYLGVKVEAIVQPPLLVVTSPADELLTAYPLLTVAGQTEPGGQVEINDTPVLLDDGGRFSAPFDLQPGVNLIRIAARRNRSTETVVLRRVVLETSEAPTVTSESD